MKIEKWNKVDNIFPDYLEPIYKGLDFCDVYYVAGQAFAVLNRQPQYELYNRLGIPEIQDVFVLPDFRRRGLATALIQHLEEEAGTEMVGISVPISPQFGPAQRLYIRLGFEPDGNGVTYDRKPIAHNAPVRLDDDLCLMLVKVRS